MLNLLLVAISEEKHTLSSNNLIFKIVTLLSFSLIIKVLINLVPLVLKQSIQERNKSGRSPH